MGVRWVWERVVGVCRMQCGCGRVGVGEGSVCVGCSGCGRVGVGEGSVCVGCSGCGKVGVGEETGGYS